jgi:LuxR family maltose regulon positive regulatory protein
MRGNSLQSRTSASGDSCKNLIDFSWSSNIIPSRIAKIGPLSHLCGLMLARNIAIRNDRNLTMTEHISVSQGKQGKTELLLTKLRAPRVAADDVLRTRLVEEIERGANHKLTLLIAPPGYGKSTLLGRWQRVTDRATGWLSLDSADNDFRVFIQYLITAIHSIDPTICPETASALYAPSLPSNRQLIQSVLNEVAQSTRPFVLIFDDYHTITSPEVQSAFFQLIQGMPVNMAVIISSRHAPDFPTLQMVARGELVELGPVDLSFSEAETAEFLLERQHLDLSPTELSHVAAWAEGWPAPLRLLARVLRGRSPEQIRDLLDELTDNVPSISDYLWDEVLETCPPSQRDFLLKTSILNQFTPELAAAVTGNQDATAVLRGLEREHLFLSRLSGPDHWYRYHHLFSDVLRRQLELESEEADVAALHARAAIWYGEHQLRTEAAKHAVLAKDWERAGSYLVDICEAFFDQERVGSLRHWLADLPDKLFLKEPRLAYWLAWARLRSGQLRQAERPLELARATRHEQHNRNVAELELELRTLHSLFKRDTRTGINDATALLALIGAEHATRSARVQIIRSLLQESAGDWAGAAASLEAARVLNSRPGVRGLHVLERKVTGTLLMAMGKLREPAELFRRVLVIGDEWNDLPVQHAHNLLGSILLEWNRPDEAMAHAMATIDLSQKLETPIHLASAHALLADLVVADGDWERALNEIERAIALCAGAAAWGHWRQFEAAKHRIWLAAGHLTLEQQRLQQTGFPQIESIAYETMPTVLSAARVRIHEERGPEAVPLLERLRDHARTNGWCRELLHIQTLLAVAASQGGDTEAARTAIDDALAIGAPEGFLRSYLAEGPRVIPVLQSATRGNAPQRNHALAVLAAAGEAMPGVQPMIPDTPSILSNRERDVMRLVATGLSNQAVADTLFISEETVKTHLRRVFEKLGVTSRTQAMHKAQQLGLI